ncbi:hypothetical protein PMAYCL1PPCAC_00472, partial [Pristionchus mayeri]
YIMVNSLMKMMVGACFIHKVYETQSIEEDEYLKKCLMTYLMVDVNPSRAYGIMKFERMKELQPNASNADLAEDYMDELHEKGEEWMRELRAMDRTTKDFCCWCFLIFVDDEAYYNHLISIVHMKNAHPFDYNTLVVNFFASKCLLARPEAAAQKEEKRQPDQPPNHESDATSVEMEESVDG